MSVPARARLESAAYAAREDIFVLLRIKNALHTTLLLYAFFCVVVDPDIQTGTHRLRPLAWGVSRAL